MAKGKEETAGLPLSKGAVGEPLPKLESTNDLPNIESPTLSPAAENAQAAPEPAIEMTDLMVFSPEASSPRVRFHLKPGHKRTVLPAAAVAIAAPLGVVIGVMEANQYVVPGRQQAANLSGRTVIQS